MMGVTIVKSSTKCTHCLGKAGRSPPQYQLCLDCCTAVFAQNEQRQVKNTDDKDGFSCGCYFTCYSADYCAVHKPVQLPAQKCKVSWCNKQTGVSSHGTNYLYCHDHWTQSRCHTIGCNKSCGEKPDRTFKWYCGVCWESKK